MKLICSKDLCTGCTACMNTCPKKCIHMEADREGFLYPDINESECIACKMCEEVCPILNSDDIKREYKSFAVINKNNEERQISSSGGFFSVIARYVIGRGGIVIGSVFDDNFNVEHICVDKYEEIIKLQGSKYVQSNLGDIFLKTKHYLDIGKLVLFTGTPCQIGGLKNYLKRDYKNLIMQDIICHGVPSPGVWNRYLSYQKKKMNSNIKKISFRYKEDSWYNYKVKIDFNNGSMYQSYYQDDIYMGIYLKDFSIRPSCYQCKFKKIPRVSDFTLGDFWGIDKVFPEMYDDKGTSLLVINSSYGHKIFDEIQNQIVVSEVEISEALQYNPSSLKSAVQPKKRQVLFDKLEKESFEIVASRLLDRSLLHKIKNKILTIS